MKKPLKVFKFGGAALADATAIRQVAKIIATHAATPLVIVVSATKGSTDELGLLVRAYQAGEPEKALQLLQSFRQRHFDLARELLGDQHPVYDAMNDQLVAVEWALEEEPHENYDYSYDQIIVIGELLSSLILQAYLNKQALPTHWLDARDLILTDDSFREGWVQWPETTKRITSQVPRLLEQGGSVLTQGFIASTTENFSITLGREGTDYTAAIMSHCLDAEALYIWKELAGVQTADPKRFTGTEHLDRLSYEEAIAMTYSGAHVLHLKAVRPLQEKQIPLYVKSFLDPTATGTVITAEGPTVYPPLIAVEKKQVLCTIAVRDFSFVAEQHLSRIFKTVADLRLQVNLLQNTAQALHLCCNEVEDKVDRLVAALAEDFSVEVTRGVELVTIRHYTSEKIAQIKAGQTVLLEQWTPEAAMILRKEQV
ncbi:MAG: aspartate kinase [Bacteroidota bacterium]